MVTGFFDGGAGGIRTHEPVRTTWFRVRPVMTTSIPLPICSAAVFPLLFPIEKGFGKNWRKEQQIIQFFEPGKTRMVTRFRLDETDSSPQDFECCTFDHSDNSPYVNPKIVPKTFGKNWRKELRNIRFFELREPAETLDFRWTKLTLFRKFSSQSRYDHFDTSPYILTRLC